ncbi:MAG: ABC transporter substrate-binding protein, partial [Anaerolineae bacterium]|nr:ABC transporter substrate-binding protein [Anaerolineae bacterium]
HQVYWEKVNANGGVAGMYPVEIVVRDNEYNPQTNVVVYNEIKDDVLAISSVLGSPTTASIQVDSAAENIVIAGGTLASQWALTENIVLN